MKQLVKIVIVLLILTVFVGTLVFLYQKSRKKPVIYEIGIPFKTEIMKKTVVTGSVIPRKEIQIKPQIIGIIDEIFVEAGELVQKGDPIARVKVTPNMVTLNNAETRYNQALIALEDARMTFERQKGIFEDSFNDGNLILHKSNPNMIKLNSARFNLSKLKIGLEDARKTLQKQKALLKKSIVSIDEYQNTEVALKKTLEDYREAQDHYQLVREETRKTIEQEYQKAGLGLKKAQEEHDAARDNLQLIKEGATADNRKDTNTLIRSTITGMVLDVAVKEGNLVIESSSSNVGTTVAIVADMNDMIFEGSIDESEVGKIREGMKLILTIGAIEKETFDAEIEYIAPKGVKVSGAIQFQLRARLKLKSSVFVRAGYSANADIVLEKKTDVLAIKERWLMFKEGKSYVEVETLPQVFKEKEVEVGLSDSINIEVLSGLTAEDRVKIPK